MFEEASMRWDPYVLVEGHQFDEFWTGRLADLGRRLLLVMGRGFDVRTLEAARKLSTMGADVAVWLLAFESDIDDSPIRKGLTDENFAGLLELFDESVVTTLNIRIGGSSGDAASSRNTKRVLLGAGDLTHYDDVVVDISAMPRMVAMTAVAVLLRRLDAHAAEGGRSVDLHVVAAESVSADIGASTGTLQDHVTQVVGFSGELTSQTKERWPRVWFPIMGEGQEPRLELIREYVDPDEICPVLPFPSRQPRRGDEIVQEHRAILFDDFQVEPGNILLASEYNPFEAYKQLFKAMERYRKALGQLGGCKLFVSPLSSKLLSIGVLLACYDHRHGAIPEPRLDVGIPYVETAIYGDPVQEAGGPLEICSMWIRGSWEDAFETPDPGPEPAGADVV